MSWRIVFGLVAIGLAAVWSSHPSAPRIAAAEDRPVALATLPCHNSLQATSSGFVLDDELVVTVAHAIYESRDFAVRDADGVWHDAFVRHLDLERDLALVQVEGLRATPLVFGQAEEADRVQMLAGAASGSATGRVLRPVRITTQVVGDRSTDSSRRGYELSLDISAGDSGAGIVDLDGDLVAIVFARSTSRDGVTWATASSEIESIRHRAEVPDWECTPAFKTDLVLRPPDADDLASDRNAPVRRPERVQPAG